VILFFYSAALTLGLVLSAPWWLLRMATTQRYREGLKERLGGLSPRLRAYVAGVPPRHVVWIHAVSVGEVLAASRFVAELDEALEPGWKVVISTTTRTGQTLARQRFGEDRVFYMPLDFAFSVRAYLRLLRPAAVVLMESEIWPRFLWECEHAAVPVAVVNARVSDRSFARGRKVKALWRHVLKRVSLWLAQSGEDARRLVAMGASEGSVQATGNLKYDVRAVTDNAMQQRIASLLGEARLVVAGSTLTGEEAALLEMWPAVHKNSPDVALLLAPRHPERFDEVTDLVRKSGSPFFRCSQLPQSTESIPGGTILILDTIGDLAAMYRLAKVAFVGGSLAPKGGHNPLEPAQFGVPVLMGSSVENFRSIVEKLQTAGALVCEKDPAALERDLMELLTHPDKVRTMGEQGRRVFEEQQGATARAVDAILRLIHAGTVQR
jgi:3-deoxy-D-manno-octulosonic-acid transferase